MPSTLLTVPCLLACLVKLLLINNYPKLVNTSVAIFSLILVTPVTYMYIVLQKYIKQNAFFVTKGNSTNCDTALRSIDRELLDIETALDAFEEHVEKEKKLLEQGEVQLFLQIFSLDSVVSCRINIL